MLNKALCFLAILSVCSQFGSANNVPLDFVETFDGTNPFEAGTWSFSANSKYLGQPVKVMPAGDAIPGYENDKGVQLTQEMKHYGFGAKLSSPIKIGSGKDLIVQYELKLVEALNCGGAYIKLLRDGNGISSMDNSSPYTIMFGPDRCGATNKVHFIVQHQNPVTHKWEEKHFNETIPVKGDKKTHLYTLILKADNQFKILVDNKLAREGSLLTHMIPAINPLEEIDDVTDSKPADWVDDAEISDPNATKPDDWDESQPRKITDANAVKPAGWLDDAPATIPNPEIQKPEDWDDEEDGDWEAPSVPNPLCEQVGCGEWTAPLIANPLYKGKWSAPKIPNPAFKGVWAPRKIKNPEYFVDNSPVDSLAPIDSLAVEIWTTNAGIHFDNFVIAHSEEAVKEFTGKTFIPKHAAESVKEKESTKATRESERQKVFDSGTLPEKANAVVSLIVEFFTENPMALAATILALLLPIFYILFFGGKSTKRSKREVQDDEPTTAPTAEDKDNQDNTTSAAETSSDADADVADKKND